MGTYALVIEPDAARAHQTGARLEHKGLTAALTASAAEALFEVSRGGLPRLVVLERLLPDGDGLELLAELRRAEAAREMRAIVIVASREAHEAAARRMIPLGISALLPRSHTMAALDRAIDAALRGGAPSSPPPAPAELSVETPRDVPLAEHVSANPLAAQAPDAPSLRALTPEGLREIAAATAQAFGTPIAMAWLSLGGRTLLELHVNAAVPSTSPLRETPRWSKLRSLLGPSPLHVPDASDSPLFAGTLPAARMPAALAAVPLKVGGAVVGGLVIFKPRVIGWLDAGVLEPLQGWAQRLAADVERLGASPPAPAAQAPPPVAHETLLESVAGSLDAALLVSDGAGVVRFANAAFGVLLGVDPGAAAGQPRAAVLRHLAAAGADQGIVSTILAARQGPAREATFALARPQHRVVRWRARQLDLPGTTALLDELTDVTAQTSREEKREELVRVDWFTRLGNRASFDDALGREIARTLRTGRPFSIAMFALDHLRLGDDGAAGAEAFRKAAWLLRSTARGYDLPARLDRLRLGVVLSDTSGDEARAFANRYCVAVRKIGTEAAPITASGGVAQFEKERTVPELLAEASERLAEARRLGGDRAL